MVTYAGDTTSARRLAFEQRYGAARVVEMFDDDGDGAIIGNDLLTLEELMKDADDTVTGLLIKKGYSERQLIDTLRLDRQVIRAWTGILAQLAGERKPEHRNSEGRGPYETDGVRAREQLAALARGEIRSVTEVLPGGANTALVSEVGQYRVEFAPDPSVYGDRGKGSF